MSQSTSYEIRSTRSIQNALRAKINGPKFYVRGYNGAEMVENILRKYGWLKLHDLMKDDFTLAWTELSTQINFLTLRPTLQLVNHIPNNNILTNKLGLLQSLREYELFSKHLKLINKFHMNDFTPKTFIIDDSIERNDFFKTFKDGDIWICKPIGANQGKGISLIRDINKFKTELMDLNIMHKNMWSFQPKIVQSYITNPLLLEGRKFDIRCYMLIASTIPYLVLFCPGYIRLSINKYSNGDDNLITHLTNQFVQKQSPKYNSVKENTVWSVDHFNDYFNDNYSHLENFKENWVKTDLTDNIKDIIFHVFKSVENKLANSSGYFELYGLDFMVDDNLKVWLIEANSNPSMSSSCLLLQQVIPPMIEEVLLIALECFEKNTKLFGPLLPLKNIKRFHVIYSENSEQAKSRKSSRIRYKIWSPPRFKTNYVDNRDPNRSKYTGLPTIPDTAAMSMFTRINKNEPWIDRWNKRNDKKYLSNPTISDYKNSLFPLGSFPRREPHLSESLTVSLDVLSGDVRPRSRSFGSNLNLLSEGELKDSNNKAKSPSTSLIVSNGFDYTAITKNKLKEILKNARA